MQEHEDGHCDDCGAQTDVAWLTFDGRELCERCALASPDPAARVGERRGAYSDGR